MPMTIDRSIDPSSVELFDCTLREGSYAVDFEFDESFVVKILNGLNATKVHNIEIGHGIGLEAELTGIKPCNIAHYRWSEIAQATIPGKSWGMFAQPEFTNLETVSTLSDRGMSFVRVGIEPDKVSANTDYLRQATEVCGRVYLNLMKSSVALAESLPRLLKSVPQGLAGVYIVDSFGAMLPRDVDNYVSAARQIFPVVGFHGHDNLGLANINSITALESGATLVDGTLNGIGRGAGNAGLESLASIISMIDVDRFDYRQLAKLAELCRTSLDLIPEDRNMQVLGGVIGVHSGYFSLVKELSAKYAIDPALLLEAATASAEYSPTATDIRTAAEQLAESTELV